MQISPNQETLEYAGFWTRLVAYLIDVFIAGAVTLLIRLFALNGLGSVPFMAKGILFDYTIFDIIMYLLKVSYFILCIYCTQTTVGKYVMKLKVVNKDGEKLSLFSIIYRETIGRFLSSILYIGYLLIVIDKEKTALHDRLCDSRVIYGCTVKKTILVRTQQAPPSFQQTPPNGMGPMGGRAPMGATPPNGGRAPMGAAPPNGMAPNGGRPPMGSMPPNGMAPNGGRPPMETTPPNGMPETENRAHMENIWPNGAAPTEDRSSTGNITSTIISNEMTSKQEDLSVEESQSKQDLQAESAYHQQNENTTGAE